ncbi:MAG: glycosyltransferase [Microthrixaceae bacterium]
MVIAAFDEAAHIARCLDSLGSQTYEPLEVVVVDDGSRDGTGLLARDHPGVEVIRTAHCGAGPARNVGARRARGEILVFLDADMTFPSRFIDRLVAPLIDDPEEIGSFTREILVANGDRRWAKAHQLGRGFPVGCHFPPDFPDRWENFRAIRSAAFWSVGGFDEVGHGEDVTVGRKLGALAVVAPGATCYHYEPDNLADIFRSARWMGRGERIREQRGRWRGHTPLRSFRHGVRLARRHRLPSLLLYRLVWDVGVLSGLVQGRSVTK